MLDTLYLNLQNPVHAFGFGVAVALGSVVVANTIVETYNKYIYTKDEA